MIRVEFYGMARQRAACAETSVDGATIAEVLALIEQRYPALHGLRRSDGGPAPQFLVSLDGDRFLSDPQTHLPHDSRLLLLSADAGG